MCAAPRAPPPESTSPTRGRCAARRWRLRGGAAGCAPLMRGRPRATGAARRRPSTPKRGVTARVELTAAKNTSMRPADAHAPARAALRAIADNARMIPPPARGATVACRRAYVRRALLACVPGGAAAGAQSPAAQRLGLLRRRRLRPALLQPRPDQPRQRRAAGAGLDLSHRRARRAACARRQASPSRRRRCWPSASVPRDRHQHRDRARSGSRAGSAGASIRTSTARAATREVARARREPVAGRRRGSAAGRARGACSPARWMRGCWRWMPTPAGRARTSAAGGQVDLTQGVRIRDRRRLSGHLARRRSTATSSIVGSAIGDNRAADVERGVIRAFDARSGAQLWSFDPLPDSAGASGRRRMESRAGGRAPAPAMPGA